MLLAFAVVVLAQTAPVGNVGFRSVDIPTAELAPLEAALDRAVVVNAASSRGRTATLSALAGDPEIGGRRAEARRAADAGAVAMRSLDAEKAASEFDRAVALFVASHGDRLDTGDLSRVYTTRAKVALLRQDKAAMRDEFTRAVPLHPTKQLDPVAFPPDAVKMFEEVVSQAVATPIAPPAPAPLADIAKRTSLSWVVAGEARKDALIPNAWKLAVTVVDPSGAAHSAVVEALGDELPGVLERTLAKLFQQAGIPGGSASANLGRIEDATPTPLAVATATPRPVPTQALPGNARRPPRPKNSEQQKRWYMLIGGAIALGAAVAIAGTQTGGGGGGGGGQQGITLVLTKP